MVAVDSPLRAPNPNRAAKEFRSIWIRRNATSAGSKQASATKNQSKIGRELRFGCRRDR